MKFSKKEKGIIGVFDSGFGGLEILREIVKILPEYDYITPLEILAFSNGVYSGEK